MPQQEAQNALQNALLNTYFANLKFLKDCDNELYERVEGLSALINANEYAPRYELEFLKDNGDFDICDTQTNTYLYYKNPKKVNHKLIMNTNKDTKGSFGIVSRAIYTNSQIFSNSVGLAKKTQEIEESLAKVLYDVSCFQKILKEDMSEKKEFETIEKFVFIGTLLGRHIPNIVDKIEAKHYFVHEPNLEIFRLSLFVLDYTILLKNSANIIFSVMDEHRELEKKFYEFLLKNNWTNHLMKFSTTDNNTKNSYDTILSVVSTYNPAAFNYNNMLYKVFRNVCEKINNYKFLAFPLKEEFTLFKNKPVLYICAGPSFGENLLWIKENQDKFFIVTIGSAYKKLLANDIIFDALITVDGSYDGLNRLQFDIESTQKLQNIFVFASSLTDERILKRFNQDKLFIFDAMTTVKEKSKPIQGYSVGETGYRILIELNIKKLYLLGTDLAIHQQKGFTHDEDSSSGAAQKLNIVDNKSNLTKGFFSDKEDLVEVEGNFYNKVLTTRVFNSSVSSYNEVTKNIKKVNQAVYNLCEHGVKLEGAIPTKVETVDVEKFEIFLKQELYKDLIEELNKEADIGLNKSEALTLRKQQKYVEDMSLYLNKVMQEKVFSDYSSFRVFFIEFTKQFLKTNDTKDIKSYYIIYIIYNYFGIINSYIEYCFNSKKLKKERQKIDKVSQIWITQVIKLIEDYKAFIKIALNETDEEKK